MNNVVSITISILLTVTLTGCGSNSYRAAKNANDYGYTETELSGNIYQLHYQCKRSSSCGHASDFALLRAAELCLLNNKPYFVILDRSDEVRYRTTHTPGTSKTEVDYHSVDVLGEDGYSPGTTSPNRRLAATDIYSGTAVTSVTGASTSRFTEPRSLLLVKLLNEKVPLDGKPAYSAQYVKDSIQAKYKLKP